MTLTIIDKHKKYIYKIVLFGALALTLGIALGAYSSRLQSFNFVDALIKHQLHKATSARNVATLFLGDSTLGNAVNANLFSELSGAGAVNLALTESLGIASALNLLTRVSRHNNVKNLVLMYTPLIFVRPETLRGYFLTADVNHAVTDLVGLGPRFVAKSIVEMFLTVRTDLLWDQAKKISSQDNRLLDTTIDSALAGLDYLPQGSEPAGTSEEIMRPIKGELHAEQFQFIKKIATFARRKSINVVYVHAPLTTAWVSVIKPDLERINIELKKSGLTKIVNSIPIEATAIGDEYGHVNSASKNEFTGRYFEILKGELQ